MAAMAGKIDSPGSLAGPGSGTRSVRRARRASHFDARSFRSSAGLLRLTFQILAYAATMAALLWLVVRGTESFGYRWQWYRIPAYLVRFIDGQWYSGPLLRGLMVTLEVSALALLLAIVFGLVGAVLRLSNLVVGRAAGTLYVETVRNLPLLIQMYLFYFVLAQILQIDRYSAAVWCLATFQGAYLTEIFRAGIVAVPRGQWEAASSLGLKWLTTLRKVVLPQAIREVIPPMTNQAIALVKQSSLVSVIAVFDLATEGRNAVADSFMTFEIWLTVAGIYLAVTTLMSIGASIIERAVRR